jgi:RNA polymerase sigma factor (sigma-70 family)
MSATLPLPARDRLVAWAQRVGWNMAVARGVSHWADECAHAANVALGRAFLAWDGDPAILKPLAAKVVVRAVNKAIKKVQDRLDREILAEDAGAPEPMHPRYACDVVAEQVIDGVLDLHVGDELRENGLARMLRREQWDALHEEVERLEPRLRRLVELRYFQALPMDEVAAALQVSGGYARELHAVARERLADALIARDRLRPLAPRRRA